MIDRYTLRARLAPPVLAAAPAIVLLASSIAVLESDGAVIGFLLTASTFVLSGLVRGRGLKIQDELWQEWGGPPTTVLLRWSGGTEHHAVMRRHALLEEVLREPLPSEAEEQADPPAADTRYQIATAALRDLTRDQQRFGLIAEENREYGFRRNSLGLKPVALVATVSCGLLSFGLALFGNGRGIYLLAGAVSMAGLCFWLLVVRPTWVRTAAELYALRLIEAAESLGRETRLGAGEDPSPAAANGGNDG